MQAVRTKFGGAITALGQDQGELGNRQSALQAQGTIMTQTRTALSSQLAGADQVDMATVLTSLSATQTRLQASYQLMAGLSQLSLTKFI